MSARDSAKLARQLLLDFPEVTEFTAAAVHTFRPGEPGQMQLINTNCMLPGLGYTYEGTDGFKTGYTREAGYCFTGTVKRDGMRFITVVMNTEAKGTRFKETIKLMDYGYDQYTLKELVPAGKGIPGTKTLPVLDGVEMEVDVATAVPIRFPVRKGEGIDPYSYRVTTKGELQAPLKKGTVVGQVDVLYQGKKLPGSEPIQLVAASDVEKGSWLRLLFRNTNAKIASTLGYSGWPLLGQQILTTLILLGTVIGIFFLVRFILQKKMARYGKGQWAGVPPLHESPANAAIETEELATVTENAEEKPESNTEEQVAKSIRVSLEKDPLEKQAADRSSTAELQEEKEKSEAQLETLSSTGTDPVDAKPKPSISEEGVVEPTSEKESAEEKTPESSSTDAVVDSKPESTSTKEAVVEAPSEKETAEEKTSESSSTDAVVDSKPESTSTEEVVVKPTPEPESAEEKVAQTNRVSLKKDLLENPVADRSSAAELQEEKEKSEGKPESVSFTGNDAVDAKPKPSTSKEADVETEPETESAKETPESLSTDAVVDSKPESTSTEEGIVEPPSETGSVEETSESSSAEAVVDSKRESAPKEKAVLESKSEDLPSADNPGPEELPLTKGTFTWRVEQSEGIEESAREGEHKKAGTSDDPHRSKELSYNFCIRFKNSCQRTSVSLQ